MEEFVLDRIMDRDPVELLEDGMVSGASASKLLYM